MNIQERIAEVVTELDRIEAEDHAARGYTTPYDRVSAKERKKYVAIDIGSSGAWLVEKETGEIFNIKGYGTPDFNKKRKADLGNIFSADLKTVHRGRWNYLR